MDLSKRTYRNEGHLKRLVTGRSNYETFFCGSYLFDRIRHSSNSSSAASSLPLPDKPQAHNQLSAELHCLLGAAVLHYSMDAQTLVLTYPYAVSKVYDIREYSRASLWGPFMSDGSGNVDWEKVEAIMLVLRYNLRRKEYLRYDVISAYWNQNFVGSSPGSYRPLLRKMEDLPDDTAPLDDQDPYGVTGTWMRLVSFLDYSDFFAYNFPEVVAGREDLPNNMPRKPFPAEEELRMVILHIRVTKIEMPGERHDDVDDEGPMATNDGEFDNTHPDFPIVHFEGQSTSIFHHWDSDANSGLRGTVRTTKEGQIRWTTFSTFNGNPRWRSEGVQLGGRRSGRGVMGNWFDCNYSRQGPCGPTAFWKIHAKKKNNAMLPLLSRGPDSLAYVLSNNEDSFESIHRDQPMWLVTSTAVAATSAVIAALHNIFDATAESDEDEDDTAAAVAESTAESTAAAAAAAENEGTGRRDDTIANSTSASAHVARGYNYGGEDSGDEDGVFEGVEDDEKPETQRALRYFPGRGQTDIMSSFFQTGGVTTLLEAQFVVVNGTAGGDALWTGQDDDDDDDDEDEDEDDDDDDDVDDDD